VTEEHADKLLELLGLFVIVSLLDAYPSGIVNPAVHKVHQ